MEDRTRMSGAYTKPSYELAIERSGGECKERSPDVLSDLLSMVEALRWAFHLQKYRQSDIYDPMRRLQKMGKINSERCTIY